MFYCTPENHSLSLEHAKHDDKSWCMYRKMACMNYQNGNLATAHVIDTGAASEWLVTLEREG